MRAGRIWTRPWKRLAPDKVRRHDSNAAAVRERGAFLAGNDLVRPTPPYARPNGSWRHPVAIPVLPEMME